MLEAHYGMKKPGHVNLSEISEATREYPREASTTADELTKRGCVHGRAEGRDERAN